MLRYKRMLVSALMIMVAFKLSEAAADAASSVTSPTARANTSTLVQAVSSRAGASALLKGPLFLSEAQYDADFDANVIPLMAKAKTGFFEGVDNVQIHYSIVENPAAKASLVIVPGFTENTLKYRELIYTFYQAGYSVYTFDPRGQGLSARMTDDKEVVWVNQWSDYVTDLKTFVHTLVPKGDKEIFLFSHSTGAAVVADALTSEPTLAAAAVMGSPLLTLNTGRYPLFLAKAVAAAGYFMGKGKDYAPGEGPVADDRWGIATASTSSVPRFTRYKRDALRLGQAQGGASFNWVRVVLEMNERLYDAKLVAGVTLPLLMAAAGRDTYVLSTGITSYCKAAKNCVFSQYPTSRHEIYNEVDEIRRPWLTEVIAFYDRHLKK
ncbi:MAG: alpha/beta hydrolase [Chitinophagaceae bacterium]|nr:alpha/beta hydrolase [Oligoflexus sp.]